MATVTLRRIVMISLNIATYAALAGWMASVCAAGGWTPVDGALFLAFLLGTPWTVMGFWNAATGLWLLHGTRDAMARAAPFTAVSPDSPIVVRTAVLLTIRNEDAKRAFLRLRTVKAALDATVSGQRFSYFVLSDTSDPAVAAHEEDLAAAWRSEAGGQVVYRRREQNVGFKAGNLADFCARWGSQFELMLPLDADSVMTADSILTMVRMMQGHPRLGILQSLVVGMPTGSAFARIFQFGMRQGMRPYTMALSWWSADCGPFWGHNALVRIAPFAQHCQLPPLPGAPPLGGHILSHDQVEAVLMRRAGFEVRVWPQEAGSYEDNPPTLADFSRRDVRWCQGNLQYLKLLNLPGLLPVSRFQLAAAIFMFLSVPAVSIVLLLAPLKAMEADAALFPAASAGALYLLFLFMQLSPKLAGILDLMVTPDEAARYGGRLRLLAGAGLELAISFLVGAAATFRLTLFMAGLPFGRSAVWNGQERDVHALSWRMATKGLWPMLAFGALLTAAFSVTAPALILWTMPLVLGYVVAIPLAVVTSWPSLGSWMARAGLCATPEEIAPPADIAALMVDHPVAVVRLAVRAQAA